jgi:hypothetical protein
MLGGLTAAVVLLAIVVALVATSRGGDESQVAETDSSRVTEPTSDTATASTAAVTSAPTTQQESTSTEAEQPSTSPTVTGAGVLGRQDTAPPGVAEQFTYFGIGDPPCSAYGGQESPTVGFEFEPATILQWFYLCVAGFDVTAPIQVTVVASDGSIIPLPDDRGNPYEGVVEISISPPLMAPTGTWTATAVQGGLTASANFQVIQPSTGSVRVVPDTGTSGADFKLELAGFAPRQPATVDIYREVDVEMMRYATSLVTSPTDDLGRAEYTLVTSPTDPAGTYCFVGRESGEGCPAQTWSQSWLFLD